MFSIAWLESSCGYLMIFVHGLWFRSVCNLHQLLAMLPPALHVASATSCVKHWSFPPNPKSTRTPQPRNIFCLFLLHWRKVLRKAIQQGITFNCLLTGLKFLFLFFNRNRKKRTHKKLTTPPGVHEIRFCVSTQTQLRKHAQNNSLWNHSRFDAV